MALSPKRWLRYSKIGTAATAPPRLNWCDHGRVVAERLKPFSKSRRDVDPSPLSLCYEQGNRKAGRLAWFAEEDATHMANEKMVVRRVTGVDLRAAVELLVYQQHD